MTVGLVYDPVYLRHDTGDHVENAGRLTAVMDHLAQTGLLERLEVIQPRQATLEELAAVHDRAYIEEVERRAETGGGWLDPDTVISKDSYSVALYAVGGAITAVEGVLSGRLASCFALVRPPGHHALRDRAMGFCVFNNIAVAARYALKQSGIERVAIIDFDVHHGNGTQQAFWDEPRMTYISVHRSEFYPGSGGIDETGGSGNIVNVPLAAGCGDEEYTRVFDEVIASMVRRFAPNLLLVSAGYDGHRDDPLGGMQLTAAGYYRIANIIKGLAGELAAGMLAFCLEGGYDHKALAESVAATLRALLGEAPLSASARL